MNLTGLEDWNPERMRQMGWTPEDVWRRHPLKSSLTPLGLAAIGLAIFGIFIVICK